MCKTKWIVVCESTMSFIIQHANKQWHSWRVYIQQLRPITTNQVFTGITSGGQTSKGVKGQRSGTSVSRWRFVIMLSVEL
jgi:hypothetical protein